MVTDKPLLFQTTGRQPFTGWVSVPTRNSSSSIVVHLSFSFSSFLIQHQLANLGQTSCHIPRTLRCLGIWGGGALIDRRQFENVFHEREHGAIDPLDFRVRRFDHVVFVRSMGAAAVAEAEMAGWQAERFSRE